MTRPLLTEFLHSLSNDELLDLMAQDQRKALNDPALLFLEPHRKGQTSDAEYLTAAYCALEITGKQIAEAKTEAQAQAARLRYDTYCKGLDDIRNRLFRAAEAKLAQEPFPVRDRYLGLLTHGWLNADAPESKPIPREHWAAGTMDWQRRQLRMDQTNKMWSGVEVFDLSELPPEIAAAVIGREVTDNDRPIVAQRALHDFLANRIQDRDNNSPELGQDALWQAAQYHFPENRVPREWVRDWVKKFMPEPLRKKPGRPALTK
jgi:hypothetical protein